MSLTCGSCFAGIERRSDDSARLVNHCQKYFPRMTVERIVELISDELAPR